MKCENANYERSSRKQASMTELGFGINHLPDYETRLKQLN